MDHYLAVLIFFFSAAITPGPNNLMVMSSGLNYGFTRSIPHMLGVCVGIVLMILCIGIGLGTIFAAYPIIHLFIKFIGVTYLLYLAWQIATAGNPKISNKESRPLSFAQAVAFQWVNPKGWVVFVGAIATFTNPETGLAYQVLLIAGAALLATIFSLNTWLWFGTRLAYLIQKDSHRSIFNISMALLLVLSMAPMIFSEIS